MLVDTEHIGPEVSRNRDLGRDGYRVESSRVRVEHRTGLSCSKLEIIEFDRADLFARLELEIFDRAKVFKELDSVRVRSSRGVRSTRTRNARLEMHVLLG